MALMLALTQRDPDHNKNDHHAEAASAKFFGAITRDKSPE
jgi:hypothetical protein